jgi:ribonuclease-3
MPVVVIFRTQSDVEASLVQGLLEANGVPSVVSASVSHAVFPLTVNELGEVRIAVDEADADEARRILGDHSTGLATGEAQRFEDLFEALQRNVDYRFRDAALLEQAMTHTSRANEDAASGAVDNESLEFLGDAVLGFVVADLLFREFPEFSEGQKSKAKASLVSTATLARQAERLGLGEYLLLGRGEEKTGGRHKQALLADSYEALIAAIYLDGGIDQARRFLERELTPLVDEVRRGGPVVHDHKSALQEHLQAIDQALPEYRLTGTTGPDHQKVFEVEVIVQGAALAAGRGQSKKEAEQDAARLALLKLITPT